MEAKEYKKVEITDTEKGILIATYGTLRKGHGNWSAILKDRSEFLGTYKTEAKFTMAGKSAGFPIVVDNGNTSIEYDLFRITDPSVLSRCHRLEGFSGYINKPGNWYDMIELENEEHGTFYMYIQHYEVPKSSIITSGNWNDR